MPYDTESPMITSGIRLGTQAATTRGFGLDEFKKVGELITKTIKGLSANPDDNSKIEQEVREEVSEEASEEANAEVKDDARAANVYELERLTPGSKLL